jgi:Leucine-rich repeat (LRR) protein
MAPLTLLSLVPLNPYHTFASAECTELSLSGRGVQVLSGFERLVNLEVLWVDHNQLQCITGLDTNTRLQQLYAHNNRYTSNAPR